MIKFEAKVNRPAGASRSEGWLFLIVPKNASQQLPSRGMVSVEGTFASIRFGATLEPDGQGGHWFKVPDELRGKVSVGETVALEIKPVEVEPEPKVPLDLRAALDSASEKARNTWAAITPVARRDWIHWITSGKKAETRVKRIAVAIDKLSKGDRRPCCFDRSGIYSKSLSCPVADE